MQVTLDGIGATHDATRHLAGGGPTFDRIVENLSRPGLPFSVIVRHNVHEGNRHEVEGLRALVERIAAETGNDLCYNPALVEANKVATSRGSQVSIVRGQCGANMVIDQGGAIKGP